VQVLEENLLNKQHDSLDIPSAKIPTAELTVFSDVESKLDITLMAVAILTAISSTDLITFTVTSVLALLGS